MKKHMFQNIVLLSLSLGFLFSGCSRTTKDALLYLEKAKGLGNIIAIQSSSFISLSKMYDSVWEYARVTEMDFKSAYDEIMGTRPGSLILEMDVNRVRIAGLMRLAKRPPKEMDKVQARLEELYDMYKQFHAFIVKFPLLSQEEYREEINIYVNDTNAIKSELDLLISEAYQKIS